MISEDEAFLQSLRAMFKIEAEEHLSAISSGLIALEKAPPTEAEGELIETTFREVHSLKGAARAVNMTDIEAICQPLETMMSAWKRHEVRPSVGAFDTFYQAIDMMGQVITAPDGEVSPSSAHVQALVRQLDTMEKAGGAAPMEGAAAPSVLDDVSSGEVSAAAASVLEVAPISPTESVDMPVSHAAASAVMQEPAAVQSVPPHAPPSDLAVRQGPQRAAVTTGQTVRISTAKLDALLLQVEEMLSVKLTTRQRAADLQEVRAMIALWKKEWSRIDETLRSFRPSSVQAQSGNGRGTPESASARLIEFIDWSHGSMRALESKLASLAASAEQDCRDTGLMVDSLLDDMKSALMLPCASMLDILPKLVRDLARDQGKEVELTVQGREVEMDRRILEEMKDPLIHILRNCVDHGLEKPGVRLQDHKPPRGTISIALSPVDGSKVEIVISDDGAGIDGSRVKAAALRLGVVTPSEAEKLDEHAAVSLIFQSAVSTSPIITELSGRGLGLAIVHEKVENLGGHISIQTALHRGTVFRIVLPVALATFRGIIVQSGSAEFVIPAPNVDAVLRVSPEEVKTVENQDTILYNGEAVALVQLSDVLELPSTGSKKQGKDPSFAVILSASSRRIAFGLDVIRNEQEVLVKPLGKQLLRVRNIAGATILGSGKVVPVLNPVDLIRSAGRMAPTCTSSEVRDGESSQVKSILVAEDSITSRMLLKNILESAGYQVRTTVDGVDALTTLKTAHFDLVVSDVDMPRMSGFDLTARIRSDGSLADIPVVLVTARGSSEDRERGVDVGANAYIVKSSFDQGNLLDVVRQLL